LITQIGYSRPLEATDLWRLEDFRLSAAQSDLLEHAFFEKYANVDIKFRESRPSSTSMVKRATTTSSTESMEELDSGKTYEDIIANRDAVETLVPDASSTLQPITSRADRTGIEARRQDASIREAEKSFVADRRSFAFSDFFKRMKTSDPQELSDEAYEKAATKAHSWRLAYALLYTIKKPMTIALCVRLLSRTSFLV
jgi:hypothetical protein